MSLYSFLHRRAGRPRRAGKHRPRWNRLFLENLEDRTLLSTFTVTTTADPPTRPIGTLRDAISRVDSTGNASLGPSTIDFALSTSDPGYNSVTGTFTIHLSDDLLPVVHPLTIDATTVTIDGQAVTPGHPIIELDGGNQVIN